MVFSHTCSKTLFNKTPHGMTAQIRPEFVALIRNISLPSHWYCLILCFREHPLHIFKGNKICFSTPHLYKNHQRICSSQTLDMIIAGYQILLANVMDTDLEAALANNIMAQA